MVAELLDGENSDLLYYGILIKNKRLSTTNPYLRDKTGRRVGVIISVCSSSAIEGIAAKDIIKKYLSKRPEGPRSQ
jgi:hypothetical protein